MRAVVAFVLWEMKSNDVKGTTFRFGKATFRPFANETAMRSPVKEPGPTQTHKVFRSLA